MKSLLDKTCQSVYERQTYEIECAQYLCGHYGLIMFYELYFQPENDLTLTETFYAIFLT